MWSSSATLMRVVLVESSGGNGNSLKKSRYKDEKKNETATGWKSRVKRKFSFNIELAIGLEKAMAPYSGTLAWKTP